MNKRIAIASMMTLLLSACGASKNTNEDPIKIGFIGPLTGEAASYGIDPLNGLKLAVDELNAKGGINGRTVQIVAEDGRCAGAEAASAAQKLIHIDRVVAIVGGQCSSETLAAAPIANAASVVMISPVSSSPDVSNAGDFIFRDYPSDALKTKAMAKYFADEGFSKVAMITENTDFTTAFRLALIEEIGEDMVTLDEAVEPGTKDFRTLVTRLQDTEFDVFFPNGQSPAVIATMMQQLREQGLDQPAISHDVADTTDTIIVGGEAVDGLKAINVPSSGMGTDFETTFTGIYGSPKAGLAFVAHSYDAANVLFAAIAAVGTDGTAIKEYLYNLKGHQGVVGTFSFDSNGDVIGIPYVLKEVQNGEWVKVADISV